MWFEYLERRLKNRANSSCCTALNLSLLLTRLIAAQKPFQAAVYNYKHRLALIILCFARPWAAHTVCGANLEEDTQFAAAAWNRDGSAISS